MIHKSIKLKNRLLELNFKLANEENYISLLKYNLNVYIILFKVINLFNFLLYQDDDKINAVISPNNPIASAKINIRIKPTKTLPSNAFALTPASPTIPIANPDAKLLNPQHNPAEKWAYPA